jgi:hypothetical protein
MLARILAITIMLTAGTAMAQSMRALPGKSGFQTVVPVDEGYYVDLSYLEIDHKIFSPDTITSEDIKQFIPMNLREGTEEDVIAKKILDHNIRNILTHDAIQDFKVVKAVRFYTEQAISTNFKFTTSTGEKKLVKTGKKSAPYKAAVERIQHRVDFAVKAAQQRASVRYRGFIDTQVTYDVLKKRTQVRFIQKFGKQSVVHINLSKTEKDTRSYVGLRTSF